MAWQELQIALDQAVFNSQLWLPVKQEILSRTHNVEALEQSAVPNNHIQVSFIKRHGLSSQGYQIKVNCGATQQSVRRSNTTYFWSRSDGKVVIDGQPTLISNIKRLKPVRCSSNQNQVYRCHRFEQLPYYCCFRRQHAMANTRKQTQRPHVVVTPPKVIDNCPDTNVSWQWFDENYDMLGFKVPIKSLETTVPTESPSATKAKHLSASVEKFEYQGAIEINMYSVSWRCLSKLSSLYNGIKHLRKRNRDI